MTKNQFIQIVVANAVTKWADEKDAIKYAKQIVDTFEGTGCTFDPEPNSDEVVEKNMTSFAVVYQMGFKDGVEKGSEYAGGLQDNVRVYEAQAKKMGDLVVELTRELNEEKRKNERLQGEIKRLEGLSTASTEAQGRNIRCIEDLKEEVETLRTLHKGALRDAEKYRKELMKSKEAWLYPVGDKKYKVSQFAPDGASNEADGKIMKIQVPAEFLI
jgi:hypothetical protein